MASSDKLHIAFVWHMHQPYYRNLKDKYFQMPWVRLHGIKDYYDMVAVLDDFPDIKQTFNLVPSLIEQIDEYTDGGGSDRHLELSRKPAADLSESEKREILENFFSAHHPTMIQPHPRYRKLLTYSDQGLELFKPQDYLDLQVWSNLAWFDPIFRKEQLVSGLIKKGEGFSEEEKNKLLDRQLEILKSIIPKYKAMQDKGQIEVSVTPYYHPILPLLCDTDIAAESCPGLRLPANKFSHPEDAEYQIRTAVEFYTERFGRKPSGMWPSEGSVSTDILPFIIQNGINWIATDEEVLACSIGRTPDRNNKQNVSETGELYRPYEIKNGENSINIIFRDHVISDRLGFVYANWDPKAAAEDFIGKLVEIKHHLENINAPGRLVSIILDGENAWEYYLNDGHDFFRNLYSILSNHNDLITTTVSEYLESNTDRGEVKTLHPGSWINHNYNVWIGHQEDNLAWDLLYRTRKMLSDFQNSKEGKNFDKTKLETAWREIYIAEGSDWCWWFGDDHVGPNNDKFDALFRSNLIYIYDLLGKDVPEDLLSPIRVNFLGSTIIYPTDYIEPIIDGKDSHFYEWYSAGFFDCTKAGSTMHRAAHYTKGIHFGFDNKNIFLRIDPDPTLEKNIFYETDFIIEFLKPIRLTIHYNRDKEILEVINGKKYNTNISAHIINFLEMKIPMSVFAPEEMIRFDFRIIISHNNKQLEVWPQVDVISIMLPEATPESVFW